MPTFSVSCIRKRTHAIQEVMKGVMKEGTHFGTIPGTPEPSLWKVGAEVLKAVQKAKVTIAAKAT